MNTIEQTRSALAIADTPETYDLEDGNCGMRIETLTQRSTTSIGPIHLPAIAIALSTSAAFERLVGD